MYSIWTVVFWCVVLEILNLIAFFVIYMLRAAKKEEPTPWSLDLEQIKSYFGRLWLSGDEAGFQRQLDELIDWAYEGERHIHKNPYTLTPRKGRG